MSRGLECFKQNLNKKRLLKGVIMFLVKKEIKENDKS